MMKVRNFCPQRNLAAIALTAFFMVLTCVSVRPQTSGAGAINGAVTDPNKAVVPGAAVTVTDMDTGVSHDYTTDSAGLYAAPFLIPGRYEVDAAAGNFGKVQAKDITLLVDHHGRSIGHERDPGCGEDRGLAGGGSAFNPEHAGEWAQLERLRADDAQRDRGRR
jgi:hypothetical protein